MPRRIPARKTKSPPIKHLTLIGDLPTPTPDNASTIERFLHSVELRPNTAIAYRADLRSFATVLGPQSLLSIQEEDVRAWLTRNTRDPSIPGSTGAWLPRTAARKLATLKAFYSWCHRTPSDDDGSKPLVLFSPVEAFKAPEFHRPDPVRLAREALRQLFDWWERQIAIADERERVLHVLDVAIFRLCYHLGLRISSAQAAQRIHLDRSDPDRWLLTVYVKGNKARRKVITGIVRADLERWLKVRAHIAPRQPVARRKILSNGSVSAKGSTSSPRGSTDAFLFLHPWTGRPLSRKRAWERLLLAGRAAGLADAVIDRISPHKLRHAIAFHALADGMTIIDVQGLLDHEDVRTTTIYVEANEAQRFSTMEQLSRANVLNR